MIVHRDAAWSFCLGGFSCYASSENRKQLEELFLKKVVE